MSRRAVPLHLPRPPASGSGAKPIRHRSRDRRRRGQHRLLQAGLGLLLTALGLGTFALLVRIPDRLDTLLLVSHAIANLIGGLSRLVLGLLQLGVVLVVVFLALLAFLLLAGGLMRLWKALLPGRSKTPVPTLAVPRSTGERGREQHTDGAAPPLL